MSENVTAPEIKMPVTTADDINDIFKSVDQPEVEDKTDKTNKSDKTDKVDILEDDDEVDEKPKKAKKDKEDAGEAEDEDELELVEDDEDVEKLDLSKSDDDIEIDAPPRKKDLLKDFPELFKKHPFLEKMLYRDKQYTELFGSFDDAKELAEKAEIFNDFDKQLMSGKTETILKNVKENDSKAFDKIVDDYLPSLARVDRDAYFEVVGNIGKRLIMDMVKKANELNNDELKAAALAVNQFLFDSNEFIPSKPRSEAKASDEQSEAEKERLGYIQERFETSRDDLQGKVDNILKATIDSYIDPKDVMTGYVKKNAVADALKNLQNTIAQDPSFRKTLDKLWRNAFDAKFSKDSIGRIQSFYLSRAKGNLKGAILKARAEALKDLQPRTKREKEDDEDDVKSEKSSSNRGRVIVGRPSEARKSKSKPEKGESVLDFFNRD